MNCKISLCEECFERNFERCYAKYEEYSISLLETIDFQDVKIPQCYGEI